jgi:hypothetical protein
MLIVLNIKLLVIHICSAIYTVRVLLLHRFSEFVEEVARLWSGVSAKTLMHDTALVEPLTKTSARSCITVRLPHAYEIRSTCSQASDGAEGQEGGPYRGAVKHNGIATSSNYAVSLH